MRDTTRVHVTTKADAIARQQHLLAPYRPQYHYTRLGVAGKRCDTTAILRLTGDELTQLMLDWHGDMAVTVAIMHDEPTILVELDDILKDSLTESLHDFAKRHQTD